jgi:hypothetical protein
MSIVKATANSRWKGALLAAVAAGALAPAAAEATLTVNLQLAPGAGGTTAEYINPNSTAPIPIYVYATVTGSAALTAPYNAGNTSAPATSGNFDGLQYLYYNILNSNATGTEIPGSVSSATLNATLGFTGTNAQPNPTSTSTYATVGAQAGALANIAAVGTTPGLSVGSYFNSTTGSTTAQITSALANIAKPRSNSPVFQNYSQATTNSSGNTTYNAVGNDGVNIIVNSPTSVSFLVETIMFTPTASTPGSKTTFTAQIPNLGSINLPGANWFQDNTTLNPGGQPQSTMNGAYASGTQAVIAQTLPGDLNLDGSVNIQDFNILSGNFGKTGVGYSGGDVNGDGVVNIQDFNILSGNFGKSVAGGLTPSDDLAPLAAFAAEIGDTAGFDAAIAPSAVPEPASLAMLAVGAGLLAARRRKI